MPRGGPPTYTYSLPPIYLAIPGTLITAAQHNTPLEDIATVLNSAWPVTLGGTGGTTAAALLAAQNEFTATQSWDKGADVASASALILGVDGNYFHVTGTTGIASISTKPAGTWIMLEFDDAITITHNGTSLILPTGANITTAAGDTAILVSEGSGNWRVVSYNRATGVPLALRGFSSANYGITAAGSLTIPHGLGVAPRIIQAILVCQSGDSGYSPGDVLYVNPSVNAISSVASGVTIVPDATNLNVRFGSDSNTFRVLNKTTGDAAALTNSNWNFAVRALAF